MGFLPANFQLPALFRSRLTVRHGTDRQTTAIDALCPTLWERRHTKTNVYKFGILGNISSYIQYWHAPILDVAHYTAVAIVPRMDASLWTRTYVGHRVCPSVRWSVCPSTI